MAAPIISSSNTLASDPAPDPALVAWLDTLDLIDPFYGDPDALAELVATAPTPELADWLSVQINYNRLFREAHFTVH